MNTPPDLAGFVAGLPKCELHVHLEGTLEPELKLALAECNGVDIGQRTVEEVLPAIKYIGKTYAEHLRETPEATRGLDETVAVRVTTDRIARRL